MHMTCSRACVVRVRPTCNLNGQATPSQASGVVDRMPPECLACHQTTYCNTRTTFGVSTRAMFATTLLRNAGLLAPQAAAFAPSTLLRSIATGSHVGGSVQVIFGAAGGVGSALTNLLQQHQGSHLVLIDQDDNALKQVASKIPNAETYTVDATQPDQVDEVIQKVVSRHKRLDGVASLVGNVMMTPSTLPTSSGQQWDPKGALSDLRRALDTNLVTAFNVLQSSARAMSTTSSGGSIVLTSAAVAETGVPNFAAMSAAKAGVEGLVRTAAATYAGKGVRVNAVAPGLTRTHQTDTMMHGGKPAHTSAAMHPVKHVAEPKDVASAMAFLLQPGTDFITGQVLAVDGGLTTVTQQTGQSQKA